MKQLQTAGVLKNAPVTYVLCKIDCGDFLSFDSHLNESQELFRKNGFPIFHKQTMKDVHIRTEHGIKIEESEKHTYHFISADYQSGVVISGGNLFIQTKKYINFTVFAELIKKAHEIYSSVTEMNLVRGIGLRYVDIIDPTDNKPLSYYLKPSVLSPEFGSESGIVPAEARMQHAYKTELNSMLFLRVFAGKGFKLVPDDLIPMVEPLFATAGNQQELMKQFNISALIDTDHVIQFNPIVEASSINIIELLNEMHKYTSHLFCNTVTPNAMEEWR
ncbi:TIGR04255 family protein [Thalassotalea sp. G2M2-11]|uniref:TIGR04255 family protein n=1 Tax=Thalassotalea sp. G2M2-11 TaxID=2787627 RepID=UPI0019CFCE03|nr:TIGR04255 family protein [Thalassotalea sp. G2M2-11]